ncbi:DUF3796 domain-containing protein [Streptococcus caviae]|uniref:DUF3796 domain-containing protein n=1 Tax=Streptococcus sp. 'caviae' TaxID=1915004 RepID=UPI00094B9504|nr:DUF3796 domain-containing protein [Streptococcus sp. 'caviae']OLN84832.1 hypothetical protein BMI76_01775 [Streptococcus sp. 'caviae']
MKNRVCKWIILIWLMTMFGLWFLTPSTENPWLKNTVFLITLAVQAIVFLAVSKIPQTKKEDRYFGLTEKLYSLTIFAAMGIYIKGVWAITPNTTPVWIKHVFLGLVLLVLAIFFLYFIFKKVEEKPDERFYADLAKAACLTLSLILACLMILSIVTFFFPFTLTAGMILIFGAAMILAFDIAFFLFEKRGA